MYRFEIVQVVIKCHNCNKIEVVHVVIKSHKCNKLEGNLPRHYVQTAFSSCEKRGAFLSIYRSSTCSSRLQSYWLLPLSSGRFGV